METVPLLGNDEQKRAAARQKAVEGVTSVFPIQGAHGSVELSDVRVEPKTFHYHQQKEALLAGKSLTEPLVGTLTLKDKNGNVVQQRKNAQLAHIPYQTKHNTFIVDGNAYSVANQFRTKPGVYTRLRRNEVPEVAFNLEKGANFKITMDPVSSQFKLELGTSSVPLYPLMRAIGVSDTDLRKRWGSDIQEKNADLTPAQADQAITKLYERLVPLRSQSVDHDMVDKKRLLREYFASTKLNADTTQKTLGRAHTNVSGSTMLDASNKLLQVFKKNEEHDDRDSLEFQTLHSFDDMLKERLQKGGREIAKKASLQMRSSLPDLNRILPSKPFDKPVKTLITQSSLSRPPDQINPIEVLDASMKVTRLGEGGISTARAIPEAARDVHPSHLGVVDPVRSPESSSIGIDVRLAMGTSKDKNGNLFTRVKDLRTGKVRDVSADELRKKAVAFPNQTLKGSVEVIKDGRIQKVPVGSVDYVLESSAHMFGPSSALLPFVDNMQGNRALMGSKQITQALPLAHREAPLVQVTAPTGSPHASMHEVMARMILNEAPEDGTIESVEGHFIRLRGKSGKLWDIDYAKDHPLNSKTYIDEFPIVKKGDVVKKGQLITDSNYTKDGAVALGRNAKVAYMAYHGENTNDAIVISESAAKNFASQHLHKFTTLKEDDVTIGRKFWMTQFPNKFTAEQLAKIGENGLPKPGVEMHLGDPLILVTRKTAQSPTDQMLGRLHSSFRTRFRDESVVWDKPQPGIVNDVVTGPGQVTVTVKSVAPLVVGDKISNSYGGKGVVSRILPDDHMPQNAKGEPLDILLAPTGVVSRINPSQLLETALSKVADKTGQRVLVDNFDPQNRLSQVKAALKEHGLSDKETVYDPLSGKSIPGVMAGKQYFYKLFKSTDTNFGARGTGSYDINEQPARGGEEGSKRIGPMELNALLAHGASGIVSESTSLKSQKNDDWWNAYKLGLPLPAPKRVFAVDKMSAMLAGAGVKVSHDPDRVSLGALTDQDIAKMSAGVISKPDTLRKKDMKPELHGLFDPLRTGGMDGEKWSHIETHEPYLKPIFRKAAATLLDMTEGRLTQAMLGDGGRMVRSLLQKVDLDTEEQKNQKVLATATGAKLDHAVKKAKYIAGLRQMNLTPDAAYMGNSIAVIPPKMRPILPGPNKQTLVADANYLYRDVMLANQKLKEMHDVGITDARDLKPIRQELHDSIEALAGLKDSTNPKLLQQGRKGFVQQITGPRPSSGYFQQKVLGRPQDLSGRGTIAPDPSLRMDEIGLPEETAKGMYAPFVMKRLVSQGYPAAQASQHVNKWSTPAMAALHAETKERPIIFNRAPTLWRYGVLGAYPKVIPGKTIRINPFVESSLGADFDGDAIQLHTPVSARAVQDAKNMTMDKLLFSDKSRGDLLAKPEMEAVSGLFEATRMTPSGRKFVFKDKQAAMQAYMRGELQMNDDVEFQ